MLFNKIRLFKIFFIFKSSDNLFEGPKQQFDSTKSECLQGSYPFNGSCYFISNMLVDTKNDAHFQNLVRFSNGTQTMMGQYIQFENLGMGFDLVTIPSKSGWISAKKYCQKINSESLLLSLDNNKNELDFIVDLLYKINFAPSLYSPFPNYLIKAERTYFIGLTYDSKIFFLIFITFKISFVRFTVGNY